VSLITVNTTTLPTPSEFTVGIMDLSKAERNAKGTMIIERVATKRKLELSWKYLTKNDLALILNAVSPVFFSVTYPDPQTNANRTGTFYTGDRSMGVIRYRGGVPEYQDVSFNLIER
jgi:hypothetical protein